jgi:hypothetical protein
MKNDDCEMNVEEFPLASELVKEFLADYQSLHEQCCEEVNVLTPSNLFLREGNFQIKSVSLSKLLESSVLYADMLDHSLFRPIINSVGEASLLLTLFT